MASEGKLLSCRAASALGLILAAPAFAQQSTPPQSTAAEPANIGDIVVTAQRRSESLMQVPLAVTAFRGETLKQTGVIDTPSLQAVTPGLVVTAASAYAQIYIRGVGNDSTTPGTESSVAIYIDGVYRSQLTSGLQAFVDLERIEVLKGPQGTLYGRNALGGAINIVTKSPSLDKLVADVSATYGNYDRKEGSLYLSAPLGDRVAFSVGGTRVKTDGFTRNLFNGDRLDNNNYYSVGGKLLVDLGESTHALLILDRYHRNDSRNTAFGQASATPLAAYIPQASTLAGVYPAGSPQRALLGAVQDRPLQYTGAPYRVYNDITPNTRMTDQGVALKVTHEAGWADFTSITSVRHLEQYQIVDYDATNRPIFGFSGDDQFGRTFTQDLQIASKSDGSLSWIVGGMYFHDRSGFNVIRQIFPILGVLQAGVPEVDIDSLIRTDALSGYAQGSYKFTDKIELTAGVRYSSEKKELVRATTIIPLASLSFPNPGAPASHRWNSLTPRASLQYRPNEDVMIYASFDQGFKSGTYNSVATGTEPCRGNPSVQCINPVSPEKINAYQGGIKAKLLDRKVDLEIAGFYYDYKDLQTQVTDTRTGVTSLQNAATARLYGLDASVRAALAPGLSLQAGGTLISAKYRRFIGLAQRPDPVNGGNMGFSADMSGNRMPRVPKASGNMTLSYVKPFENGSSLALTGNVYYSGSYFFDSFNRVGQDHYAKVNLRAEYALNNGLSFAVWARNLTDKATLQSIQVSAIGDDTQWEEPRMYGVTVRFKM